MKEDIKDLRWLEIFLWYKCNVRCSFCYQKDLRHQYKENISKQDVVILLEKWFFEWKRFVIFSGGEPTLDVNLPFYIEYCRELWFKHIRVHSNGFKFKDYSYLEDLYLRWLTWVTLSVHWYKWIHDHISWVKGSFYIIQKALINFQKLKKQHVFFVFDTNTVVCRDNYKTIKFLISFLVNFDITRWQLVLAYSMDLFSHDEKSKMIPEYKELKLFFEGMLDISYKYNRKFVLENVPFCVIDKKYWGSILNNIKIWKDSITIKEWNIWNTNLTWMTGSEKCNGCKLISQCRGVPKDYYQIYWDSFVNPISND